MQDKPNAAALALLEESERALGVWKAIEAEFAGKDMPAAKKEEADRAWQEFERLEKRAEVATETATKAKAVGDFEARYEALKASTGRVPVGVGMTDEGEAQAEKIVYKAHRHKDGDPLGEYTPTESLTETWKAKDEVAYTKAFRRWLTGGRHALKDGDLALRTQKALSAGSDVAGGFWVVPEVFATEFITALADEVLLRREATVMPAIPRGSSVTIRTGGSMDAAQWVGEIGSATADTSTPAGVKTLTPHDLAASALVSNTLLAGSEVSAEGYVRSQIAELFDAAEETAGMTGTGVGQWEGIYTSALPTDVTCTSATAIAYADLLEVEGTLKAQYQNGAKWLMHRTIRKELLALVDGVGLPLLRRDPAAQANFELFGYPILLSEYSPSSSAASQYVAALGNLKRAYRIVDSLAIRITRADELHIATDQTGFYARKGSDGMVVDGNALVRLIMHA